MGVVDIACRHRVTCGLRTVGEVRIWGAGVRSCQRERAPGRGAPGRRVPTSAGAGTLGSSRPLASRRRSSAAFRPLPPALAPQRSPTPARAVERRPRAEEAERRRRARGGGGKEPRRRRRARGARRALAAVTSRRATRRRRLRPVARGWGGRRGARDGGRRGWRRGGGTRGAELSRAHV